MTRVFAFCVALSVCFVLAGCLQQERSKEVQAVLAAIPHPLLDELRRASAIAHANDEPEDREDAKCYDALIPAVEQFEQTFKRPTRDERRRIVLMCAPTILRSHLVH